MFLYALSGLPGRIGGEGLHKRQRLRKREILLGVIVIALVLGLLYAGLQWLDEKDRKPETRGDYRLRYEDEQVTIDGVTYRQRQNLTTILFIGVDQDSGTSDLFMNYRNGGQADFLRLMVIDPVEKAITQIQIDRDTITPVITYNVLGKQTGQRAMQITLSHSFGDGKKLSCELTAEAVSNLLFNVPVNYYAALNLDGISALNDSVGGVTVEIKDDFSKVDPTMVQGTTMRLVGDQAEYFVRSRRSMEVGTNEARMVRQQTYISQLMELISGNIRKNQEFIGTLFDALSQYLVTNLSRSQMINEAWKAKDYERKPLVEIPGVHQIGMTGFMEFYADENALQKAVLDVFYQVTK